jgi:DNA-directed RNA polymerase specialized sigma24 family protein
MRPESRAEAEGALYRMFKEHSSELYWLAFLLTGDREQSIQACTRAFDLEDGATPVFQEFMVSWARKLVITASLATIRRELRKSMLRIARSQERDSAKLDNLPSHTWISNQPTTKSELERAVFAIDVFPKCVLLLTVFERLSIEQVALLLNANEALVRTTQSQGLIELTRNLALGRGWTPPRVTPTKDLHGCRFISASSFWPQPLG